MLKTPLHPGSVAQARPDRDPADRGARRAPKQAVLPAAKPGDIAGVVWRDFKPGGGVPGKVEKGELGLPGVTVQLRDAKGHTVQSATSADGRDLRLLERRRRDLPGRDRRADVRQAVGRDLLARPEA